MNFKNYYEAVQKTFKFRIKSIYVIDDETMDAIEKVLDKYRPSKVSQPKKMMFQTTPLGFTGVKNVEVYFVDIETTVPGNAAVMAYDLRATFGLAPDSDIIQVEAESEPVEDCTEDAEPKEALLTQPDYPEACEVNPAEHFGDAYNSKFLAYVKDVEKKRDLNKKVDAPHPITKWDKQPDPTADLDTTNFNDYLPDAKEVPARDERTQFRPKTLRGKK